MKCKYGEYVILSEAATGGVLQEKVFLEILQNSQKNTCASVSFSIKLQAEATNGSSRDTTNASNNATDDSSSPTTSAIDAITRSSITYISGVGRVTVLAIGVWSIFRI